MQLKNLIIAIVVVSLVATLMFNFIMTGSKEYGNYISNDTIAIYSNISDGIEDINKTTKEIEGNVREMNKNPLTSVFLIPDAIADIFNLVLDSVRSILTMGSALLLSIGIPDYVMTTLEIIVMLTFIFLIINAVIKWRT